MKGDSELAKVKSGCRHYASKYNTPIARGGRQSRTVQHGQDARRQEGRQLTKVTIGVNFRNVVTKVGASSIWRHGADGEINVSRVNLQGKAPP